MLRRSLTLLLATLLLGVSGTTTASAGTGPQENGNCNDHGACLTDAQQRVLYDIARQTWLFFDADTDPNTHLPMDNIGLYAAPARGTYTSPSNVGVYLWSMVAAKDLKLASRRSLLQRATATLTEVEHLSKWHGFLFSWYDTTNGHRISGPGGTDREGQPAFGELISTVDSGWYAAGLIAVRQAFPELAARATALFNAMNFGIFYDTGDQATNITAGQMYGGYLADQAPAGFHYGLLNTETRIAAYIGMGKHEMPGDVWWRTWRTLPRNFDWQGQPPVGPDVTYRDPQSGKSFSVLEAHYTYAGTDFVPSWGGSQFEALMPNLAVPESNWGRRGFGLNDRRYAEAQIAYATTKLNYRVWGLSPASTPDDTGGYDAYGARGMSSNANCCPYDETAVTPHASFLALDVVPQQAFANIQALRTRYPSVYDRYGFFDAVNPVTGSVGHRYLVLDQAMIMAALDNALRDGAMQRHFASDPVIRAAMPYLGMEAFSIH